MHFNQIKISCFKARSFFSHSKRRIQKDNKTRQGIDFILIKIKIHTPGKYESRL